MRGQDASVDEGEDVRVGSSPPAVYRQPGDGAARTAQDHHRSSAYASSSGSTGSLWPYSATSASEPSTSHSTGLSSVYTVRRAARSQS